MKKKNLFLTAVLLTLPLLFFSCASTQTSSGPSVVEAGKVTMVDGVSVDMTLFKKWGDCAKYMKETNPAVGSIYLETSSYLRSKGSYGHDSRTSKDDWVYEPSGLKSSFDGYKKTEKDQGAIYNLDFKETDSEIAAKLFSILRENNCKYGYAYINMGDEFRRYTIALKGEKIRFNRYCYYKTTHKYFRERFEKEHGEKFETVYPLLEKEWEK